MSNSAELAQLRELIEVFPSKYTLDEVEEANTAARTKFEFLDNEIVPDIAERLKLGELELSIEYCFNLCLFSHRYIFADIISNNGEFRKENDPNSGRVYFGGQKTGEVQPEFVGVKPDNVRDELESAFQFLCDQEPDSPLRNALNFYQKFVKVHPFYDGNGRISRLFVNIYLLQFNLYIDWKSLQKQAKFLKKLNRVHKTENERDFKWLLKFCKKSTSEISDTDVEN